MEQIDIELSDVAADGGADFPYGKELLFRNNWAAPASVTIETRGGSIIRFTVNPGGTFTLVAASNITRFNIAVEHLDFRNGLHVVQSD